MKKFKTPDEYLMYIEDALEGANHHDSIETPRQLFDEIENIVSEDKKLELARIICKVFDSNL